LAGYKVLSIFKDLLKTTTQLGNDGAYMVCQIIQVSKSNPGSKILDAL